MRLTVEETVAIKRIVAEVFGKEATVRLFGSRVDDSKRGGDVDLYVVAAQGGDQFFQRVTCMAKLEGVLHYPVDLVVAEPLASRPIDRLALKTGVVL